MRREIKKKNTQKKNPGIFDWKEQRNAAVHIKGRNEGEKGLPEAAANITLEIMEKTLRRSDLMEKSCSLASAKAVTVP